MLGVPIKEHTDKPACNKAILRTHHVKCNRICLRGYCARQSPNNSGIISSRLQKPLTDRKLSSFGNRRNTQLLIDVVDMAGGRVYRDT